MKTIFVPIAVTLMIISTLITSCGPGRKMQTATQPTTKTQKGSNAEEKAKVVTPQTKSEAAPAIDVNSNFEKAHPLAKNTSWSKSTNIETNKSSYTVTFLENEKHNWIIYSENGDVLEERQEILIDQLPQNIYNAIKETYPTYKIASATTYKHINKEGSYVVVLKPISDVDAKQIEVIYRENASEV